MGDDMYIQRITTSTIERDGVKSQLIYILDSNGKGNYAHIQSSIYGGGILSQTKETVEIPQENAKDLLTNGGHLITSAGLITIDDFIQLDIGTRLPDLEMTEADLLNHTTVQEYTKGELSKSFSYKIREEKGKRILHVERLDTGEHWKTQLQKFPDLEVKKDDYKAECQVLLYPPRNIQAEPRQITGHVRILTRKEREVFFLKAYLI